MIPGPWNRTSTISSPHTRPRSAASARPSSATASTRAAPSEARRRVWPWAISSVGCIRRSRKRCWRRKRGRSASMPSTPSSRRERDGLPGARGSRRPRSGLRRRRLQRGRLPRSRQRRRRRPHGRRQQESRSPPRRESQGWRSLDRAPARDREAGAFRDPRDRVSARADTRSAQEMTLRGQRPTDGIGLAASGPLVSISVQPARFELALCQTRGHLRHVPQAGRALAEVAHEPSPRRRLGLR